MSEPEQPRTQRAEQPSLYRKHRPRTFADVVGQDAVVRTLHNAIERDAVHHAYLFVGSRGTGKTSMAKILAACLNCERGPTTEPCGRCESCRSIANASSLDVIEMDAASNNSVDDIRELREGVAFAPVSGRRKVYILDEAHMLSTAAWNAFLKTLEEPPPNTVFVLATTEAQKVPPTVVDRCHRFDFQRPTVEQLAGVVSRTADAEAIEIPPAAVAAIARAATGSFRDALGTLEQLVTYSGRQIELADVLAVLGVADAGLLEQTVDAIAAGDSRAALTALEQCARQGRDAASFAADLERRARELLVVQTLGAVPAELSLTAESDAALEAQAGRTEETVVVRLLELLGDAMEAIRAGADPRTRLELCLVKAARPELDASARALLQRVERLERDAGRVPGEAAAVATTPAAAEPLAAGEPPTGRRAEPPANVSPPATAEPRVTAEPGVTAEPAPRERIAASRAAAEAPASNQQASSRPVQALTAVAEEPDLEALRALWPAVVEQVRSENALLGALIDRGRPVSVAGEELTVAFAPTEQFLKKKAEVAANRTAVTEALGTVAGGRWRLAYELSGEPGQPGGEEAGRAPSDEDLVRRLMEEFDAEELTEPPSDNGAEGRSGGEAD